MPVNFNGNVTVNGNMEVFGDGSVKISDNQVEVKINDLKTYINKVLPNSINKQSYESAVNDILSSDDESKIRKAYESLKNFVKESGRSIWISGLSGLAQEVAKNIANHINK